MKIAANLFPYNIPQSREYEIINSLQLKENRLVENYYYDHRTQIQTNWFLNDRKGNPIYFDGNDCEWLSPTFIRNKDILYGFSLVEKGSSIKLYLTAVKGKVDFESFEAIGRFYAKDKHRFYFGPGAKIIKEDALELFFDDTYKKEWMALHPDKKKDSVINLWNSKIAIAGERVYWKGKLAKEVHGSLKRITSNYWADDYSVFEYNLQNLKKVNDFDRASLVYKNDIKGNSIKGMLTDKYKPVYCYVNKSNPNKKYDFKRFASLFEELRNELDKDVYWWYKMEKEMNIK